MSRGLAILTLVALICAPGLYVLGLGLIQFSFPWWHHLAHTVLPAYLTNSLLVAAGATVYALAAGGIPAWLTYRYVFRGRAWCIFSQMLALTIPAYIAAGLYLEAWDDDFFTTRGALAIELGAAAAPLAFLFLRLAMARLPATLFEAAAALGSGPVDRLRRVGLPLLAAPLAAAACLVAAEALGEFGAASRVGVTTLSVGMHQQWRALQRPELATMLALVLFLLAALLSVPMIRLGVRWQRANPAAALQTLAPRPVSPLGNVAIHVLCFAAVIPGFWAPFAIALDWTLSRLDRSNLAPLFYDAGNTLSTAAACVILCLLVTLAFTQLLGPGERVRREDRAIWLTTLNYLMPSLVFALAWLNFAMTGRGVVILATSLKLLPLMLLPIADAIGRLPAAQVETARALGSSRLSVARRVLLPQLRQVLVGGALLVFVLAATELTLALTLQPFGYSALSLRIFGYAGQNSTRLASVWIICLCLLCLYPIWRLSRLTDAQGSARARG